MVYICDRTQFWRFYGSQNVRMYFVFLMINISSPSKLGHFEQPLERLMIGFQFEMSMIYLSIRVDFIFIIRTYLGPTPGIIYILGHI